MPLLLFILSFFATKLYLLADLHDTAIILYSLGLHIIIIVSIFYFAISISYEKLSLKAVLVVFGFYRIGATIFYIYCQINKTHEWHVTKSASESIGLSYIENMAIPLLSFFLLYILYVKLRRFDYKNSDYPNENNVLILFRYPKNFIGLMCTYFYRFPVSSVCLYADGFKYGFIRESKRFEKRQVSHSELLSGKYYIIDTKKSKSEFDLNKFIGTEWKLNRNCFNIFDPVIGELKYYVRG